MEKDFNALTTDQKYDLLKQVVEKVRETTGNGELYAFQEQDGYVNLVGARGFNVGKACTSQNLAYDDTLFVVFSKDGQKRVEEFVCSTEYGSEGTAYLALGQHRYRLHYHKENTANHLNLSTAMSYQSGHKYRALEPDPAVRILRDTDRDMKQDEGEVYEENNASINIHYGGEYTPAAWSEGCQVIKGWANYKAFIELVEADHSIKGTDNNELASVPSQNGTRSVIYTLVSGSFIEEILSAMKGFALPIDVGGGRTISEETLEQYYAHTEKNSSGGYFPVGVNTVWHGGVHIYVAKGSEVHACMPGRIVAARLAEANLAEGHYGSRNFILIKHEHGTRVFYSLYMHLNPLLLSPADSFIKSVKWLGRKVVRYRFRQVRNYRNQPSSSGNQPLGQFQPGDEAELVLEANPAPWKKVRQENGSEVFVHCPPGAVEITEEFELQENLLEKFKSGKVIKLDIPVSADQVLWKSGEFGSEDYRTGLLHWEIFSQKNLFPPSETSGSDAEGGGGGEGGGTGGSISQPPPVWQAMEDGDGNFNMDSAEIIKLFEGSQDDGFWNSDEILTADELKRFFSENPNAAKLRTCACRFVSEWGISDLDRTIEQMRGRWITYGLRERLKPYQWWAEARDAGVHIPSALCWHYNPIAFLETCSK